MYGLGFTGSRVQGLGTWMLQLLFFFRFGGASLRIRACRTWLRGQGDRGLLQIHEKIVCSLGFRV